MLLESVVIIQDYPIHTSHDYVYAASHNIITKLVTAYINFKGKITIHYTFLIPVMSTVSVATVGALKESSV